VSSNLTVALVLIVLLTVFRFGGQQMKGIIMNEKSMKLNFMTCEAKRCTSKLSSIVDHFFETVWATGASVAATMVISPPSYRARL
jgi:uncharacterized membrane protein